MILIVFTVDCRLLPVGSQMIGKEGFEPSTPCSQSMCASQLRYFPLI